MRLRLIVRWGVVATTAIGFLAISACGKTKPEPVAGGPKAGEQRVDPSTLKDEIPGGDLAAVMAAHYAGLGHMERYEYREAVEAFRSVQKRAPGWIPGAINLAIALLNDSGVKAEEAKKAGGAPSVANFDEARVAGGSAETRAQQSLCSFLPGDHAGTARQHRGGTQPLQAGDGD